MWLRNCWQVIAFAREIGDAPLARTVCGEEVVLFRTAVGQGGGARRPLPAPLRAALARARHRRADPVRLSRDVLRRRRPLRARAGTGHGAAAGQGAQLSAGRAAFVRLDLARRRGARRSRQQSRTCTGATIRPGRWPTAITTSPPTTSSSTTTCSISRMRASCMRTRSATRRWRRRRSPSTSTASACACTATCTTWKRRRSTSAPPASPAASTAGTPTRSRRRACTSSRTARCRPAPRTRAPRSSARCSTSSRRRRRTTTHYFWAIVRQFKIDDQALTDYIRDGIAKTFDQDKTVLEAQQRVIGGDPDRAVFPVSIRVDAGADPGPQAVGVDDRARGGRGGAVGVGARLSVAPSLSTPRRFMCISVRVTERATAVARHAHTRPTRRVAVTRLQTVDATVRT